MTAVATKPPSYTPAQCFKATVSETYPTSRVGLQQSLAYNNLIFPLVVRVKVGSHDPISIQLTLKIFGCVMEFVSVHKIQFLHPIIS